MPPKTLSPISRARSSSPITRITIVPKGQDPNKVSPVKRIPSSITSSSIKSASSLSSSSLSPSTLESPLPSESNSCQSKQRKNTSSSSNDSKSRVQNEQHKNSRKKGSSLLKRKSLSPTKDAKSNQHPHHHHQQHHHHNQQQQHKSSQSGDESVITWEVERVLGKKQYKGKTYYKLKWVDSDDLTWEVDKNCQCDDLILKFEQSCTNGTNDELENEWEVERILDKRVRKDKTEYLIKWKGWPGDPTWERAEDCHCINLVAAFENPKLKKMWNFQGSNITLWLKQVDMLQYMERCKRKLEHKVALLKFEPDFPEKERQVLLHTGLNIGPLCYENHWYLVIIFVNHICITRKILVGDALNTLIGTTINTHPVIRRLTRMYPTWPIKPFRMTQMDRSDMCAYCTLAAFERALFLYNPHSQFIVENIFYDLSRAELIRHQIKPETHGEITVALPLPECVNGPTCEFCDRIFSSQTLVDEHINSEHIIMPQKKRNNNNSSKYSPSSKVSSSKVNSSQSSTHSTKSTTSPKPPPTKIMKHDDKTAIGRDVS